MSTTSDNPTLGNGWLRVDGSFGVRNHVVALSTVALADQITRLGAASVPETLCIAPQFQRGLRQEDAALQNDAIAAIARHGNTGAILVVTHDEAAASTWRTQLMGLGKPVIVLAVMSAGGVENAVQSIQENLEALSRRANEAERAPLRLSDLTVALECGGSDVTSALCANPVIGRFVDRLVLAGGSAIVSETAEFIGGEAVVRSQSVSTDIGEAIISCIAAREAMMTEDGDAYRGMNPTQENIEAGLSTLTEKTMGAVCKIGAQRFASCLSFGQGPVVSGLHFMDTPFFSPVSLSGMALAGAQLSLFAMGVFNPSGMPLLPTIKLCGNPKTLSNWQDGIDLDVSAVLGGSRSLDAACDQLQEKIVAVINGEQTKAEQWSEGQLILPRILPAF